MLNQEKLNLFFYYMREREQVRLKKESGQPWPFTKDEILKYNKFTNVLRKNDRTSRWFIKYWATPNLDKPLEVQLYNCGLFRYFGTIEFASTVGYQAAGHSPQHIIETAREMLAQGLKVFTGAYVITNGGIKAPKEEIVANIYLEGLWKKTPELVKIATETKRWELVAKELMKLNGWGGTGFMTKECLSDAMFTSVLQDCIDRNTWSPCGPGARRGLNWLHDRSEDFNQKEDKFLEEMKELFSIAPTRPEWDDTMPKVGEEFDLHGIQFALCEIYKYQKVKNGLGRPRSGYGPDRVNRKEV